MPFPHVAWRCAAARRLPRGRVQPTIQLQHTDNQKAEQEEREDRAKTVAPDRVPCALCAGLACIFANFFYLSSDVPTAHSARRSRLGSVMTNATPIEPEWC